MKKLNVFLGFLISLIILSNVFGTVSLAQDKITVYVAASLTNALKELATLYEQRMGVKIQTSFASSSVLAKQIEAGAPADIFISADLEWMDYLEGKNKIEPKSRRNLLSNSLVVIAPKGKAFALKMEKGFNFAEAFHGKLAMGDPDHVPAGKYGKEALIYMGWWDALTPRIVRGENVRAALAFVERGEADAGIVYATDAKQSDKVEVLGTFPEESHKPITYPAALIQGAGSSAKAFLDFLSSEQAGNIFTKYGFIVLKH
ncbi:MAG TPA: molybdate ABC transporter substrate-binding protein [Candidatus Limnocylindrales bacterium]|nr:molybdate ABC transporter substrate-binding protein [Candidatus Limnocylindrales bacterium]